MTRTNHSRSAFTLIELLVVISIIGILASLLLPVLSNAKKKTNRIVCINNIRQVGSALLSFSMDNNDLFPWQLGPFDQKMHFGSMDPFSVQTIVSTTAMKNELGTPKILMSPCDPERKIPMNRHKLIGIITMPIKGKLFHVTQSATHLARVPQSPRYTIRYNSQPIFVRS